MKLKNLIWAALDWIKKNLTDEDPHFAAMKVWNKKITKDGGKCKQYL